MKAFGERLYYLRKENNLSTKKLGLAINVSDATISRWENNIMSPTIDELYKLANFFKVSADYLIGLEE